MDVMCCRGHCDVTGCIRLPAGCDVFRGNCDVTLCTRLPDGCDVF